ncbi:MAG: [FeFe] hydrogenase H-cluster radical SAM maturase HydG [Deltaproteobacteria bacterium]
MKLTECEKTWQEGVIKPQEAARYLEGGRDFIDDRLIEEQLKQAHPDPARIREIIAKALSVETLLPAEAACLLNLKDEGLWQEVFDAAAKIKNRVYDNRVVTFAPLYVSSLCVNNCAYCGFRSENDRMKRRRLSLKEIEEETRILCGDIGHKRLILVCGEHPSSGADYICDAMKTIYGVKVRARSGEGQIRRVNVNAAPMDIADFRKVKEAGIGTYQVFQETYHHATYARLHPYGTLKSDFKWRLYSLHRAMEAGIDDVAIGALFGLYDWKFEVMGMLCHARDLEKRFGLGPHTVSVPRLEPASNAEFTVERSPHRVSDEDFRKVIAVLRLSIPYAGLIVTCRETPSMIRSVLPMCTQRDASTRLGIGAYAESKNGQEEARQQFILGDDRSLDEVIRELASMDYITSFCTAGYRCGRTGKNIMTLLKTGKEGCFCKLNAILTFQEWLCDFASPQTQEIGAAIIQKELEEVRSRVPRDFTPHLLEQTLEYWERIKRGDRDLSF